MAVNQPSCLVVVPHSFLSCKCGPRGERVCGREQAPCAASLCCALIHSFLYCIRMLERYSMSLVLAVLLSIAGVALPPCTAAVITPPAAPTSTSNALKCQTLLPLFPGSNEPVKRVIVDDLTSFLHETLQQHGIHLLLVLPGPSSDSNQAQQDSSAMKIDWQKLTGKLLVDHTTFVHI